MQLADSSVGAIAISRIAWVDYAKGICIILVVMMQATLDYGDTVNAEGWLHHVVAFARPFRMPDFFLLAGLFLAASINSAWREYLDRKVLHFVYFYLLWLSIQLGMTETGLLLNAPLEFIGTFTYALIEPTNSLWFVHMLAIFYLVTRLLRKVPPMLVFALALALQSAFHLGIIDTQFSVINHFADRYVYFFVGYAAAPWIFRFASHVVEHPLLALAGLAVWALINGVLTTLAVDQQPGTSLLLGFAGAAAVVATGSLLANRRWAAWLAYAGTWSIVIYLTAFLPMKVLLKLFASTGIVSDVGLASALITLGAVCFPLLFHYFIRDTWLNFLYQRPAMFSIRPLAELPSRANAGQT